MKEAGQVVGNKPFSTNPCAKTRFEDLRPKAYPVFLVVIIIVFAAFLRARFIGHTLGVDEANNYLAITTMARGYPGEPFNQFFFYHPPLYMISGYYINVLFPFWGEKAIMCLSITLSLAATYFIYLISRKIFNRRAALFASLSYATLPAAMVMDSWMKAERMEVLFSLMFIYFFLSRRRVCSTASLCMAVLSKETVVFTLAGMAFYVAYLRDRERIKDFLAIVSVAACLTWWWFAFFSQSEGKFLSFLAGSHSEAAYFHLGWNYYLAGIHADLGTIPLILALLGVISILARAASSSRKHMLPVFCFLIPLAIMSLLPAKPPWLISSLLSFAAMLAGFGADRIISLFREPSWLRAVVALALAASLSALAIWFSYQDYMGSRQKVFLEFSEQMRAEADKSRDISGENADYLAYFGMGNTPQPVYIFYLKPGTLGILIGEESCQEIMEALENNAVVHVAIWIDDRGLEIAKCLQENAGVTFVAYTDHFLIGHSQ